MEESGALTLEFTAFSETQWTFESRTSGFFLKEKAAQRPWFRST